MADPLLGSLCKLYRAEEHLRSLDGEMTSFLQPGCYEIINEFLVEGQINPPITGPTRGIFRRRVIFKNNPPLLRWGTIIGDAINNLRSSLDQVIYSISYSRNPTEFRDDRSTEFPICDSPDAFNRPRRRARPPHYEIRGIPPDAQAIVEGLQPYNRGKDKVSTDPLWILREMSNIDKHRSIHVTTWSAYTIALDITHIAPGTRVHSHWVRPPGVIENGAPIVEVDMSIPGPSETAMYMEKEFWFTIAFDEGTPLAGQQVQEALYELAVYVEGVVSTLSSFIWQ